MVQMEDNAGWFLRLEASIIHHCPMALPDEETCHLVVLLLFVQRKEHSQLHLKRPLR